jgi:hypothetical protein
MAKVNFVMVVLSIFTQFRAPLATTPLLLKPNYLMTPRFDGETDKPFSHFNHPQQATGDTYTFVLFYVMHNKLAEAGW